MKKIALIVILCSPLLIHNPAHSVSEPSKAPLCAACHGNNGNSSNPEWPNLAGQNERYFIKQLHDFKDHTLRSAPTMDSIAATLTEEDIKELAVFYANSAAIQSSTPTRGEVEKRGEQLYKSGDFNKHITACIACHGPKGQGNAEAGFPVLAGQHAVYTIMQLQLFKNKKRTNDLNHIMQDISQRMDEMDMASVAHYIEELH